MRKEKKGLQIKSNTDEQSQLHVSRASQSGLTTKLRKLCPVAETSLKHVRYVDTVISWQACCASDLLSPKLHIRSYALRLDVQHSIPLYVKGQNLHLRCQVSHAAAQA